jgi:hypothetical protein
MYCNISIAILNVFIQASFINYILIAYDRLIALQKPFVYRAKDHGLVLQKHDI